MILADKIILLRKKAGWSQEELANEMSVSRQSVSKWEGAQSIPDMDKILMLAEIFSVSTDFLLKDNIEQIDGEQLVSEESYKNTISLETASKMIDTYFNASIIIGLGVALIILSTIPIILAEQLVLNNIISISLNIAEATAISILLISISVAVGLFIMSGFKLKEYEYITKEPFELQFGAQSAIEKRKKDNFPKAILSLITGIALIIVGIIPIIFADGLGELNELLATSLFLILVSIGVYFIINSGMRISVYETLLNKASSNKTSFSIDRKIELVAAIYWPFITVIYLAYSFLTSNWHISWIVWPVAGVFFAVIVGITNLYYDEK